MTPFGGWDMPLVYTSTLEEHRACREHSVVFDVSHLGTLTVAGPGALACLQDTLTNDLDRISVGKAQYTHLLDEVDGHVVDDIIVWWVQPELFYVMPNASNTARIVAALSADVDDRAVTIDEVTAQRAVLAVQGPSARAQLSDVDGRFSAIGRFGVETVHWEGIECIVAGTGYTGEDGVEIHVPSSHAERLWDAVLAAQVQPAGLGARDTLRLEAALPLHGHDLGPGITPLHAGLQWVVGWDKPTFQGRTALLDLRERGPLRKLIGLTIEGRQPPRAQSPVVAGDVVVGEVSSGNFSPVLGCGIALAFVDAGIAADSGATFHIDIRGRQVPATRVALPFVQKSAPR